MEVAEEFINFEDQALSESPTQLSQSTSSQHHQNLVLVRETNESYLTEFGARDCPQDSDNGLWAPMKSRRTTTQ